MVLDRGGAPGAAGRTGVCRGHVAAGAARPVDAAGQPETAGAEPGHSPLRLGTLREVTLIEVARMGLRANLTLLAGSFNAPIAMEQYRAASAIFDPLVSADFDLAHDESPATAAFFGVYVFEEDTFGVARA